MIVSSMKDLFVLVLGVLSITSHTCILQTIRQDTTRTSGVKHRKRDPPRFSQHLLWVSAPGVSPLEGQQSSRQEPPEEPFFVVHEIGTESPCSYSNPAFVQEHFACCPCCLYFSWRNQLILLSFSRLRTLTLRSTKQSACRSTRLLLSPSSPAPGGFTVSPTKCLRISSKVVSGDIRNAKW